VRGSRALRLYAWALKPERRMRLTCYSTVRLPERFRSCSDKTRSQPGDADLPMALVASQARSARA
jgi:hypothetical protein